MPRIMRTVVPRIRKSLEERGVFVSLCRSFLLPVHLFQEYRNVKRRQPIHERSDFDRNYQVDTDGDFDGWTHLSDLNIPSPNWIRGNSYVPIEPSRFHAILERMNLKFDDYVFIDFGSGKGRALLMASEFPFKRVMGIEFSPELHLIAQRNIAKFGSQRRRCDSVESTCMDFAEFVLPPEPSVLFFFDPCDETILAKLLSKIDRSVESNPRPLYLIYVAPTTSKRKLLESIGIKVKLSDDAQYNFCLYRFCEMRRAELP